MFDSSSLDKAIQNLIEENSSSDENQADLNLDCDQTARIPVDPLIADKIRQQQPEDRVPLVSSSSDDETFSTLQQPQPAIVPIDIESPPKTREDQNALNERKIRARPYTQNENQKKVHFYHQKVINNKKNTRL